MIRDKLSSKERMSRFYRGEKIDRIPYFTNATMYAGLWCGLTAKEFYGEPRKSYYAQKLIREMHCCDGEPEFDFPVGALLDLGGRLEIRDYEMMLPKIVRYPITSLNEAIDYVMPSVKTGEVFKKELEFVQIAIRDNPDKSVTISAGSPMTKLFNLVEPGLLLRWFIKEPEVVHKLLGQIIDYLSEAADFWIETFGIGRCVASANYPGESCELISPKVFKEFAFPYILKIHDILRKKGIKKFNAHLCGSQDKHLEYYKELSWGERSFISVDERTDIRLVSNILGRNNIYAGNVPSAYLISKDSTKAYDYARDLIQDMKYNDGGFILMPSCDLPMNAKPQSINAMLRAVRNFGKY